MTTFAWVGRTRNGQIVKGERTAETKEALTESLRREQILVTQIAAAAKKEGKGRRINAKSLAIFTRQFSVMIDAGLPLVQCLELLSKEEPDKRLAGAIEKVEELARREFRQARTWVVQAAEEGDATADAGAPDLVRIANAGLLTRDRIVGRWSGRVRRLVYGRIMGTLQAELAEAEGITQSAVSQTLSTAGAAAVIAGYRELVDPA